MSLKQPILNRLDQYGLARPIRYGALLLASNPKQFFSELVDDIYSDFCYQGEGRNVVCFASPKSGSTLLESIMCKIGFVDVFHSVTRRSKLLPIGQHEHSIVEGFFSYLPRRRRSFIKTHSHYSPTHVNLVRAHGLIPFVLVRDLRDMMISRYYHVMSDRNHWQHELIRMLTARDPEFDTK